MTLADLRTRFGATPRWAAAAAIAATSLALVAGTCNRASRLSAEVEQLREAARLRAAGAELVEQVKDLRPEFAAALARNADLEAALADARRAAPGAQPVAVVTASTGRVTAGGAPRHVVADVVGSGYAADSTAAPAAPVPPASTSPPPEVGAVCLLAPGDVGEVRVDEVVLETGAGNRVLVGAAAAYRLTPGPEAKLFGGRFSAPLTQAVEKAQSAQPAPRWGAGPLVAALPGGAVAGALLAAPRLRLPWLGWEVDALAGGAGGPGGWMVLGGAVLRL